MRPRKTLMTNIGTGAGVESVTLQRKSPATYHVRLQAESLSPSLPALLLHYHPSCSFDPPSPSTPSPISIFLNRGNILTIALTASTSDSSVDRVRKFS